MDLVGPFRAEQTGLDQLHHEVTQRGGVQHTRIEEDRKVAHDQ